MTATTEASTYPISAATRRELERPLFGHFIDGEVVESLEGGTMPVIDPATGGEVATAAAGTAADVDRAARPVTGQAREVQRFRHDALTGEGGIAMNKQW